MYVEDHPRWEEFKACIQGVIDAKEALKSKRGSQADVDRALAAYYKIADEI